MMQDYTIEEVLGYIGKVDNITFMREVQMMKFNVSTDYLTRF